MAGLDNEIRLVLSDYWFDEIKSGRKTHEYRVAKWYWIKRFIMGRSDQKDVYDFVRGDSDYADINPAPPFDFKFMYGFTKIVFQRAYRKDAETMTFWVRDVRIIPGKDTDLKTDEWVFDVKLGNRIN